MIPAFDIKKLQKHIYVRTGIQSQPFVAGPSLVTAEEMITLSGWVSVELQALISVQWVALSDLSLEARMKFFERVIAQYIANQLPITLGYRSGMEILHPRWKSNFTLLDGVEFPVSLPSTTARALFNTRVPAYLNTELKGRGHLKFLDTGGEQLGFIYSQITFPKRWLDFCDQQLFGRTTATFSSYGTPRAHLRRPTESLALLEFGFPLQPQTNIQDGYLLYPLRTESWEETVTVANPAYWSTSVDSPTRRWLDMHNAAKIGRPVWEAMLEAGFVREIPPATIPLRRTGTKVLCDGSPTSKTLEDSCLKITIMLKKDGGVV